MDLAAPAGVVLYRVPRSGRDTYALGSKWQIRGVDDWVWLPLLLLLLSALSLLATPVLNTITRHYEHEADRCGIEVNHGIVPNANQVAAHYFEESGEINLNDPAPSEWVKIWFYDHPTRPERVHSVATYDPRSQGEKGGTCRKSEDSN